jgi:predicted AAA+ superfamily ATPase
MPHIARDSYIAKIEESFSVNPICALLGPRQCGKTTIAKEYQKSNPLSHLFDLEDPDDLQAFASPKLVIENLDGLIIIDEVQRAPELFNYLRVLVDKKPAVKILILGSASPQIIRRFSETLAGRISYIEMTPFSALEVSNINDLWLRGGFPKSYLAASDQASFRWRHDFVRTFLEKDIASFGFNLNPQRLRRFWMMLCDYHGNIFNASELGRSIDLDQKTVKHYLDILSGTFMIRQLQPWFINISKRQIKSYKIYFRDSGLFHSLINLSSHTQLSTSSKLGNSWEGFAMEEVIRFHQAEAEDCFFWATQSGAELDLLIVKSSNKLAFEFKYTSQPKITKSMIFAIETLGIEKLTVIIPGNAEYLLSSAILVKGLGRYIQSNINKQ